MTMTSICFCAFLGNVKGLSKPYAINLYLRLLEPKAIAHILRFCTYVGTTLPGAADHCFGDFSDFISPKPKTLNEILTRFPHG